MRMHNVDKDILKSILNQIAGNARKNEELLPEVAIKGSGYIWCYDLIQKNMVRVVCESKCYILDATKDELGRILVYTINNDVILVEEDKIIYTGYD